MAHVRNPLNNKYTVRATWDISSSGTLATNAGYSPIEGDVTIPEGAIITDAYYIVPTTFTDENDESTELALGTSAAAGCFVATVAMTDAAWTTTVDMKKGVIGTYAATGNASAAPAEGILEAASYRVTTANEVLKLTLADDEACTAGKLVLFVEYVLTGII